MEIKEVYSTQELIKILMLTAKSILARARRESWQSQPRVGRGGGNEWLIASLPASTRCEIRTTRIAGGLLWPYKGLLLASA